MEAFEAVARRAGGVCSTQELRRAGVGARVLASAVASGRLLRVRRGLYAVPDVDAERLLAVHLRGRLAGLSAAASYGLWSGWGDSLHVCVPANCSAVPPAGPPAARSRAPERPAVSPARIIEGRRVVVHWSDDPHDTGSPWRVSVPRMLRQVLRWHDLETGMAVVESALWNRRIAAADLPWLAAGLAPAPSAAVASAQRGAQSGLETIVRIRIEALGFVVERQARVAGVGRVDLRLVGTRVVVEVDGYAFHSTRREFAEDRRRDAEAAAQGLVALRFTAEHVRDQWDWIERMVLETVASSR